MKVEWTREELIRTEVTCGFCGHKADSREPGAITHSSSCPFSDETVDGIHLSVWPAADPLICGRCSVLPEDCPVFTVGSGWDMVTSKRLELVCHKYAASKRLMERLKCGE